MLPEAKSRPLEPFFTIKMTPNRAHLIGIIILTRHLSLSLTRYETLIEKVEGSPMFTQLWPVIISTTLFPGAQMLEPAKGLTPNTIGQLRKDEGDFSICYRHPGLAREYLLNAGKMKRWGQNQPLSTGNPLPSPSAGSGQGSGQAPAEVQALRRQLRLINTRNRLTHVVLMGIAAHQAAYLASGDPLDLRPLSQVALAEWIRSETQDDSRFLPPGSGLEFVDHSMISRLTRGLNVLSPQGQDVPLRDFFPSTRDVHKRMIEAILNEEREQIRQGNLDRAYTDEKIKKRLKERFDISVSRRTVSVCRQGMRIPSSYTRNGNYMYPPRPVHFSFHYPLNVAAVKANAPEVPGVYEIALADAEVDYPSGSSGVVYIGSTKNLRKRLRDHLRPGSKNGDLRALLDNHRAVFRYIVRRRDGRAAEKLLGQCFTLAYGALPCCNHIRP